MDSSVVGGIFGELLKVILTVVSAIIGLVMLIFVITGSHGEKKPVSSYDKIKSVKVGLPVKDLRKIMGEPSEFRMNGGDSEDWRYEYQQNNGDTGIIFITIENDSVSRFFSY